VVKDAPAAPRLFFLCFVRLAASQRVEVFTVSSFVNRPGAVSEALAKAIAAVRTRSSWNDRLDHWERPPSESEEAQIQRAAAMVRNALSGSAWLAAESVTIEPQGSYHNNTNVRQEADMDLRAMHPSLKVEYGPGVIAENADASAGLVTLPRALSSIAGDMRAEMSRSLIGAFGTSNVAVGTKAIRVDKRVGSRADVDIVPAFGYRWITWNSALRLYDVAEGVAILGTDGSWTRNFPAQHTANGVAKRARTKLRFKKVVRSLKRLRDEMVEMGMLEKRRAPSFFIECLAHWAGDDCYLDEGDDRYGRILRVLNRLESLLLDPNYYSAATEVNGIKLLFHASQPWMTADALAFVQAAKARLRC
jgi:hypothetical protein